MTPASVKIELLSGAKVDIEPVTFDLLDAEGKKIATAENFPLNLAYATTIHKAQGQTLDQVVVNLQSLWEPGHAYVAPGGRHLRVMRSGGRYVLHLGDDDPVNHHRPSVDVLFASLADSAGPNAVAALLTGMGADGARGLLALREAGARTFAQDQATSVVWGMPGEAMRLGAAERAVPLPELAKVLLAHVGRAADEPKVYSAPADTNVRTNSPA